MIFLRFISNIEATLFVTDYWIDQIEHGIGFTWIGYSILETTSGAPENERNFYAKATWVNDKGEIFLQDIRSHLELDIRQYLKEKYENSLPAESDLRCAPRDLCIARYYKRKSSTVSN